MLALAFPLHIDLRIDDLPVSLPATLKGELKVLSGVHSMALPCRLPLVGRLWSAGGAFCACIGASPTSPMSTDTSTRRESIIGGFRAKVSRWCKVRWCTLSCLPPRRSGWSKWCSGACRISCLPSRGSRLGNLDTYVDLPTLRGLLTRQSRYVR